MTGTKGTSRHILSSLLTQQGRPMPSSALWCALAVYLNEHFDIIDAIRRVNCAAGFCVSRRGVLPAMVDRTTLELYLSSHGP
ncbi:MAG: hypothetical protein LBG12_05190 [Synergistaceae bacterium]|jgi:ribokinase|nr:hypothetical protein [Synergistaceae bacterium]